MSGVREAQGRQAAAVNNASRQRGFAHKVACERPPAAALRAGRLSPSKRGRVTYAFDGAYSPPPEGETASEASGGGRFSTFCAKPRQGAVINK
jgi:hypothetical protein